MLPPRTPSIALDWIALGFIGVIALPALPAAALDADPWDQVLRAHAHRGGMDYAGLAADAESMARLDGFLADVATMSDDEPLASWLNAYNAIVVREVVRRYPLRSVRDVPGFFDRVRHRVAGRSMTLDHLEHRVIRPRFRDGRVHVALSCAARSCPAIHPRAFQLATLDAVLDRLARATVADARHVRPDGGRLAVSEIFSWFSEDFIRDAGSVRAWIDRYDATDRLRDVPADATLSPIAYDWRLNDRHR